MRRVLSLLMILLCCGGVYASSVPDIAKAELEKLIAQKSVTLLDCTSTETYKKHHLPGAIHYYAQEWQLQKLMPADKNALIVAYCTDIHCGAWEDAVEGARKLGYTNIKHYSGGIFGWIKEGGRTEAVQ